MSIPWSERQVRIAEIKRRQLEPPERPRFAIRLARRFIGDDYDEEVIPAVIINFFGIGIPLAVLVVATGGIYLVSRLF